jgi:uncharacterized protein DUF6788
LLGRQGVKAARSDGFGAGSAARPPGIGLRDFLDGWRLTDGHESVSFIRMRRERALAARTKLLDRLPVTGDILRGSLLTRTIRNHAKGCARCASGEGHRLAVLAVSYPGARTRQFSLRRERVAEVRRWLANYQKLKAALEAICELNHDLLRPDDEPSPHRRRRRPAP